MLRIKNLVTQRSLARLFSTNNGKNGSQFSNIPKINGNNGSSMNYLIFFFFFDNIFFNFFFFFFLEIVSGSMSDYISSFKEGDKDDLWDVEEDESLDLKSSKSDKELENDIISRSLESIYISDNEIVDTLPGNFVYNASTQTFTKVEEGQFNLQSLSPENVVKAQKTVRATHLHPFNLEEKDISNYTKDLQHKIISLNEEKVDYNDKYEEELEAFNAKKAKAKQAIKIAEKTLKEMSPEELEKYKQHYQTIKNLMYSDVHELEFNPEPEDFEEIEELAAEEDPYNLRDDEAPEVVEEEDEVEEDIPLSLQLGLDDTDVMIRHALTQPIDFKKPEEYDEFERYFYQTYLESYKTADGKIYHFIPHRRNNKKKSLNILEKEPYEYATFTTNKAEEGQGIGKISKGEDKTNPELLGKFNEEFEHIIEDENIVDGNRKFISPDAVKKLKLVADVPFANLKSGVSHIDMNFKDVGTDDFYPLEVPKDEKLHLSRPLASLVEELQYPLETAKRASKIDTTTTSQGSILPHSHEITENVWNVLSNNIYYTHKQKVQLTKNMNKKLEEIFTYVRDPKTNNLPYISKGKPVQQSNLTPHEYFTDDLIFSSDFAKGKIGIKRDAKLAAQKAALNKDKDLYGKSKGETDWDVEAVDDEDAL